MTEGSLIVDAIRSEPAGCGGKATGIAKLRRIGLPVPPTRFFDARGVNAWLRSFPSHARALESWAYWRDLETLDEFRERILGAQAPRDWGEVARSLELGLASRDIFFRSSMAAEDSAEESLAGAFESIRAPLESSWEAARAVIASAFSREAAERVLGAGLDPRTFGISFLAQAAVPAKLAGTCFSRPPEAPWEIEGVVEWTEGPGERVARGAPGTRVVAQGGSPPGELAPFWRELWRGASLAERELGAPADLEWVWDGRALWWVQLRALATPESRALFPAPPPGSRRARPRPSRWSRELSLERFPEPMSALGWSVIEDSMDSNLAALDRWFGIVAERARPMASRIRGWIYSDPDYFSFPGRARVRWMRYLAPWRAFPWRSLAALVRALGRTRLGLSLARRVLGFEIALLALGARAKEIRQGWAAHVDRFERDLQAWHATPEDELRARMRSLREVSLRFLEPDFAIFLVRDRLAASILRLCEALEFTGFERLVAGIDGNRTLLMADEWERVRARVRADPGFDAFRAGIARGEPEPGDRLAREARGEWREFLELNGHSRFSWDVATASWKQDPRELLPLLDEPKAPLANRSLPRTAAWESALAELLRAVESRVPGNLSVEVADSVRLLRDFMRMDEELHFLTGKLLDPSRALVLEAGARLVADGRLARADDVFHLTIEEIRAPKPIDYRLLAGRRAAELARARGGKPWEQLPPERDTTGVWEGAVVSGAVAGRAVSSGIGRGTPRFAESIGALGALEGEIVLVTTSPNPTFVPLYPRLAALVTRTGGLLSHGFVAAREQGLPAVSGVAIESLAGAARIEVDGSNGQVRRLG